MKNVSQQPKVGCMPVSLIHHFEVEDKIMADIPKNCTFLMIIKKYLLLDLKFVAIEFITYPKYQRQMRLASINSKP